MASIIGGLTSATYGFFKFGKQGFDAMQKEQGDACEDIYSKLNYDLSGRSFLVTGANSGMGYSDAYYFADHGATVHMICRDETKGSLALNDIKQQTGNHSVFLHIVDLAEIKEVKRFAQEFLERGISLDVIVNNASTMLKENKVEITDEGIEKTLASNTVQTFLLTNLLIPVLQKSNDARVINIVSGGAHWEKLTCRSDYLNVEKETSPDSMLLYSKTKRHQIVLTELFAQKYAGIGIKFLCMHPGYVDTKILSEAMPKFYTVMKHRLRNTFEGADTAKWLAVSKRLTDKDNGQFFRDRKYEYKHMKFSNTQYTQEEANELWNWLSEMCSFSIPGNLTGKSGIQQSMY